MTVMCSPALYRELQLMIDRAEARMNLERLRLRAKWGLPPAIVRWMPK